MDKNSKIEVGAVKIHKEVIAAIAAIAAMENEGVKQIGRSSHFDILELLGLRNKKSIKVEFGKNDEMRLEIPLIVKYGYAIPEIAERVQESIRQAIEKMIEKTPRDISINIQGIEKG